MAINGPLIYQYQPLRAANTLFLDRDGVLNDAVVRGKEVSSPRDLDEVNLADDIDALASPDIVLRWNLLVLTNQPDLSRGSIDLQFLSKVHDKINELIPINAVYVCPHQKAEDCICRKPGIGMIQKFRNDHPELYRKECMVGDRISDWQCALKAGMPFVLRKRPYNKGLVSSMSHSIDNLWELKTILNKAIGKSMS